MEYRARYRVYYEDTDCLGMVYHANYLKYFERGRTEWLEQQGQSLREWNASGYLIVVHSMQITFRKPARLGDWLEVISTFQLASPVRGVFTQRIECDAIALVLAEVVVVCINAEHKIRRFPTQLTGSSSSAPS